ncbi:MAG TPA: hypothetical protein VMG59_03365 [Phycisphaerae bacterium]|nr:hypothetical protein [Phycisphaerae bacterium]
MLRASSVYAVALPAPKGAGHKVPLAIRVVELSNDTVIVTILLGESGKRAASKSGWRTLVFQISPAGKADLWKPGKDYPTGAIWYADGEDNLYGFDSLAPEWIYVCRPDGQHVATLLAPMLLKNPITPAVFAVRDKLAGFAAPDRALSVASLAELRQAATETRKSGGGPRIKSRLLGSEIRSLKLPYIVRQHGLRHTYRLHQNSKGLILTRE